MTKPVWWVDDRRERFWMEITSRSDLGADLRAPQSGSGGRVPWHYALVAETKPGDIVFHWYDAPKGERALVGWSEVRGPLTVAPFSWTPRSGPSKGRAVTEPAWVMPLEGFTPIDPPLTLSTIAARRVDILAVEKSLRARVGTPTYFPFTTYGPDGLRAAQAYLTKFPAALVDLLESEFGLAVGASGSPGASEPLVPSPTKRGAQGFLQDAAVRQAIELRAVDLAIEHYRALRAESIEILGKPYDLRVKLDGVERHVEVKGSSAEVDAVLLTRNEVRHAREFAPVDLILVESIRYDRIDGEVSTSGGKVTFWSDWTPADEDLEAQEYRYRLPLRPR